MKRRAFGRDAGLSTRMFLTIFLLGALYVAFFSVLTYFLNVGWIGALLIIGVLAFIQYWTSDKIALAASRAKVVTPDQAPELPFERHLRGREREELVELGAFELLLAEEDVAQAH